jgi:rod shape-determining protein MreD
MNWIAFTITAWLFTGLQMGLGETLAIGTMGPAPSLVFVLCVFVTMHAPHGIAMWCALILGLIVDLITGPGHKGGGIVTILGPNALGFLLGAQLCLAMRGLLNKRNPLTIGLLSVLGFAVAQVVVMGFYTIHRLYGDPLTTGGMNELVARLLAAAYTGGAGVVLACALIPATRLFGFAAPTARRFAR